MTEPAPLVSVIVPHLNQPDELRRCLSSLQGQSLSNDRFETIVVDNGSKILPTSICQAFQGIRLEQEATPGPGPARNKGAHFARGQIFAFLDADCVADCGWLLAIADTFASDQGRDIVGGDVRIIFSDPA